MMYQCELSREGKKQVAWIPDIAAIEGADVELKEDNLFWRVEKVMGSPVSEKFLRDQQRLNRGSLSSVMED